MRKGITSSEELQRLIPDRPNRSPEQELLLAEAQLWKLIFLGATQLALASAAEQVIRCAVEVGKLTGTSA